MNAAVKQPPASSPPRATLSSYDYSDLEWLYGEAPALFERSTSGGVLERLEQMSPFQIQMAGFQYGRPGTEPVHNRAGDVIGRRDATSARPTAEVRAAGMPAENDDYVLRMRSAKLRYARVSRRVRAMLEHVDGAALYVEAFAHYFGDSGNQWARLALEAATTSNKRVRPHVAHGRIGALYVLTDAGQRLLEYSATEAKKKGWPDYGFSRDQRMQLEVGGEPTLERKALLSSANKKALALFTAACIGWNETPAGAD